MIPLPVSMWVVHGMHGSKLRMARSTSMPFIWSLGTDSSSGVLSTPLLESVAADQIKGIDVLRAIRSFDPCMPCATHIDTGRGTIVREVNSCGCTLE